MANYQPEFRASWSNAPLDEIMENHILPTQENIKEIKQAVDLLATFLKNKSGYSVAKVFQAGSLKKGTNLRGFSDVDLVVFLNDFDSMEEFISGQPAVLDDLESKINGWHVNKRWRGNNRWEITVERGRRYALHVEMYDHRLQETILVDVLPTFDNLERKGKEDTYDEMDNVSDVVRKYYSASLTECQCDWVLDKTEDAPCVEELIRLVKYWRKKVLPHEKGYPSSYLLELLTIRAWENVHPGGPPPNEFFMEKAFKRVLSQLVDYSDINMGCNDNYCRNDYKNAARREEGRPFIMDPANPFNNVCDRCWEWEEVAAAAEKTSNGRQLRNVEDRGRWDN